MSNFFDNSHVTDVGLEGSAGPSVSIFDMVQQGFRQQYQVDSARALDEELRTRWAESLRALGDSGQRFNAPVDPQMYRGYAEFVREGTPITMPTIEGTGYGARVNTDAQQPHPEFEEMQRANEAIRRLNNPDIKSFEQILEEVSEMQRGVEQQTAAMGERAGVSGWFGELVGAIGGSFTGRDPLNIITAPIGAGRTVATRIATDMALAAGVTAVTEFTDVAPNRELARLPERNPFFNIVAAGLGAGIIRGGIEGIGYGIKRARNQPGIEDIDFDLRDTQLQQMFGEVNTPTARAGAKAIDDVRFLELNNPYGEGRAAQARFIAELQDVQRVMGGEPMTAVARALPPIPFDQLKKVGDFEIVKEQAPEVYARLEAAQARLAALTRQTDETADVTEAATPEPTRVAEDSPDAPSSPWVREQMQADETQALGFMEKSGQKAWVDEQLAAGEVANTIAARLAKRTGIDRQELVPIIRAYRRTTEWETDINGNRVTDGETPQAANDVAPVADTPDVAQLTGVLDETDQAVLATAYDRPTFDQEALRRFVDDFALALTKGLKAVPAAIRNIIKKVQHAILAASVVLNPAGLGKPAMAADGIPTVVQAVIKADVPEEVAAVMTPSAQSVYQAVAPIAQRTGRGFMLADKPAAMIHVFGRDGRHIASSRALYGRNAGDAQGTAQTPAGTFRLEFGDYKRRNPDGTVSVDKEMGGALYLADPVTGHRVFSGENVVVAVHKVFLGEPSDNRLGRLASDDVSDNKASAGCINTTQELFIDQVVPNRAELENGLIFIMPEDASRASEVFSPEVRSVDGEPLRSPASPLDRELVADIRGDRRQSSTMKRGTRRGDSLVDQRRAANKEYEEAYRAVEAEAARIRETQARIEAAQQTEAVNIFADAAQGRPFNMSLLQHDHVAAMVDAINAFNDTLDEAAVARFVRQMETEGEEGIARETWRTEDGRIDIGLREPVDPDFRVVTEDGDRSIADVMRDLQDDADLDEAIRTCLI